MAKSRPVAPRKPKPTPTAAETSAPDAPTNEVSTTGAGKSLRSSTARKREELEQKRQEREAHRAKMLKKPSGAPDMAEIRRLTQEELLAEAKITEQINLASLGECKPERNPGPIRLSKPALGRQTPIKRWNSRKRRRHSSSR